MITISYPKLESKKAPPLYPGYAPAESIEIKLGALDFLATILDDELLESRHGIVRGDDDLQVGVIVGRGFTVQYSSDFNPGDLVIFPSGYCENISENLGIVSSYVCIRIDKEELKKRGSGKPVILKWEKQ